jgi:DnaK suppressor protein
MLYRLEFPMPSTLMPTPDQPRPELLLSLPALRAKLEEQRQFRIEQLAELSGRDDQQAGPNLRLRTPGLDGPRSEVNEALVLAALQALADIDAALCRMRTGRYGACQHCGVAIALPRLRTVPQAALCFECHRDGRPVVDRRHGEI